MHTIFRIGMEQLDEKKHLAILFQRVAKVAVVLARDFIVFLLHSAKENFKNLVDKIKLFANAIFDHNYKNRETSLARIHRLIIRRCNLTKSRTHMTAQVEPFRTVLVIQDRSEVSTLSG
jgi:hypothetical protein